MIDPVLEDAVNAVNDRADELQAAQDQYGRTSAEAQKIEEAVCLAVRFAVALFLPAWEESGRTYEPNLTHSLQEYIKKALKALPPETQYFHSVEERLQELEDHVTLRKGGGLLRTR